MLSLFDRNDFPMLSQRVHGHPLVYLDSAATALKPRQVLDAMTQFYASSYSTVHRGAYTTSLEATHRYHQVREQVQAWIHAAFHEEIVFTRGTTEGLNLIARSYGDRWLEPGDEILISGQEHHSNIVPWQLACGRTGARLRVMPLCSDGSIDLTELPKHLTPRTKLVSVTHVSNVLGVVNPIESIITAAHNVGAHVVIDAAQSVHHVALDVQALDCDFLVFSSHKMYGPTGVGVLYGKKHLLDAMPPYQGGGDMVHQVTFESTTYQDPPLKFEAGTPMIGEVMGLGATLTYLQAYGLDRIREYEQQLIEHALATLPPSARILGPSHGRTSLITWEIPGLHPLDLATLLDLKGIAVRSGHLCAQPLLRHFGLSSALRLSCAPYTTHDEIDQWGVALRKAMQNL